MKIALRRTLFRNRVTRAVIRLLLPVVDRGDLVRLGSGYGGWWVPERLVRPGATAYCAGVGHDISFDLELVERYDCEVWAFDPTPAVIEWVAGSEVPGHWHFEPVGLWERDGTIRFHLPAVEGHVSLSATNVHGVEQFVEAPVETLESIARRLGHRRVDLVKMDVEGAEGPVLRSMLAAGIRPTVLCVEFDQPEPPWTTVRRIRELLGAGYVLNKVECWNYTFSLSTPEEHWARPRVAA
jgi:FkbM family methyltransferase